MVQKIDKTPQLDMFKVPLKQFIQESHKLVKLTRQMEWDSLEEELGVFYCLDNGRPGVPIRTVSGMLLLKRMFDESDESVIERWTENPYWQYFCGETYFQHEPPFDRTELIKFRKRIGEKGAEILLKMSILLFPKKEVQEKEVLIDTTVQEKNITYPTDVKLQKKIIEKCRKIAKDEGVQLRQTYKRELNRPAFPQPPKRKKKARAAARRIKVIAGKVYRDLCRKLDDGQQKHYSKLFRVFDRVLEQQKDGKDKIYSIYQPHVKCIAKGKEAKKYEFGNKSSIAKTKNSGIIIGALAFSENIYDGDTLSPQLKQVERLTGKMPKYGIVDRGYRGRKKIEGVKILTPGKLAASATRNLIQKTRKQFRARAGIEPVIGHIKRDHRMWRNFLLDEDGDKINTILAATGFNLRKMLQRIDAGAIEIIVSILQRINLFNLNLKLAA
jgi:transposase, IS5 family